VPRGLDYHGLGNVGSLTRRAGDAFGRATCPRIRPRACLSPGTARDPQAEPAPPSLPVALRRPFPARFCPDGCCPPPLTACPPAPSQGPSPRPPRLLWPAPSARGLRGGPIVGAARSSASSSAAKARQVTPSPFASACTVAQVGARRPCPSLATPSLCMPARAARSCCVSPADSRRLLSLAANVE